MDTKKRNLEIYALRKNSEFTLDEIGKMYGMSRQSVDQLIRRIDKQLGKETPQAEKKYPAKLGGFFTTQEQVDFIEAMNAKNYSEKLRKIIQFYIDNHK